MAVNQGRAWKYQQQRGSMRVYVLTFDPLPGAASVGGFEWRYTKTEANAMWRKWRKLLNANYEVTFRLVEVPFMARARERTQELSDQITDWLAENYV